MADSLKENAKKALGNVRIAAQAAFDEVSVAAHNTLVGTEADVQNVAEEMKSSVDKAVADTRIAAKEAKSRFRKK